MQRVVVAGAMIGALAWPIARVGAQSAAPAAAATCVICHAVRGAAADAPNVANLGGLSEDYFLKQMHDYRDGRRTGIMAPIGNKLTRSELRAVAAHFARQDPAPQRAEDAALAARGKALYEAGNPGSGVPNCVGCHGPNGGDSPRYPKLVAQPASYTIQQMSAFKNGTRANDRARVMREIALRMTDDEIKAVAEYAAGLR